jgi:UDP-glucuronate 4-epimerase
MGLIAVTGGAGFIGGAALRRRPAGTRVVSSDRRPQEPCPHVHAVTGDLRDSAAVAAAIPPGTDAVLHLAALAGVAPSIRDPQEYVLDNVFVTANVLQRAVEVGARRVVIASSSSVYGDCYEPAVEDQPLAPLSPYAASKVAVEALAESYVSRGHLEVVVLRPFTVYGPRQRTDMAMSLFLRKVRDGAPIDLWDWRRDFTYVDDVVTALWASLEVELTDPFRAYNLGSGRPVDAVELLSTLEQVVGRDVEVVWGQRRSGEPLTTWADPTRSRAELGMPLPRPLFDGLLLQAEEAVGRLPAPPEVTEALLP